MCLDKEGPMDDKTFEEILKTMGAMLEKMEPDPDCPPDYVLLDYAYEDLDESEAKSISEHMDSCERCQYEVMKMEADRFDLEQALSRKPDAALAQALGPDDLRRLAEAINIRKEEAAPSSAYIDRIVSFAKRYSSRLQAGWDSFQAAMAVAQEWLSVGEHLLPVPAMRGADRGERASVYRLGSEPPVYLAYAGRLPHLQYQTLIMLRPHSKDMVVLYENKKIQWPLHISPQFREDDVGVNLLYLVLTATPLEIAKDEELITPDRFVEIMTQVEQSEDDHPSRVVTMEVEVQRGE
jgi:hypothetical protein